MAEWKNHPYLLPPLGLPFQKRQVPLKNRTLDHNDKLALLCDHLWVADTRLTILRHAVPDSGLLARDRRHPAVRARNLLSEHLRLIECHVPWQPREPVLQHSSLR